MTIKIKKTDVEMLIAFLDQCEGQITAARTETSASQSAPEARDSIERIQLSPDLQRAEEGEAIQASIAFESSSNGNKSSFLYCLLFVSFWPSCYL